MLEAKNMNITYDCVRALRGVSISLNRGEIVTLIGANGAGKTSVLRAITGLRRLDAGEIVFEGERMLAQGPATDIILSAAPRDEIGVASGVNDFGWEIGGTIGVAVLGSILTHVYRGRMAEATPGAPSTAGDSIMAAQQVADTQ